MTIRFGTDFHPLSRTVPYWQFGYQFGTIQFDSSQFKSRYRSRFGSIGRDSIHRHHSALSSLISRMTISGILSSVVSMALVSPIAALAHPPQPTSLPTPALATLGLSPVNLAQLAPATRNPANPAPVSVRLPEPLAEAVRRESARQLKRSPQSLRITAFSRETWPDTCLGLKRNDVCTAVITPGWRLELTDGNQSWFYRTDDGGLAIRPERFDSMGSLPKQLQDQVLAAAVRQTGAAIAQLTVSTSRPQMWDSCLGVANPRESCNPVEIPGWQVIVSSPQQYWVFHTDQKGAQIRLNPVTSGRGNAIPNFLGAETNWPPVNENSAIVFQSIQTGGIAGKTYQLVLQGDGQLLRINIIGNSYTPAKRIALLSPQQVKQFRQLLDQQEFTDFKEFSYPPIPGAADYFTILLQSQQTKIQYSDIQHSQLPPALQRIVQAWNTLTSMR